MRKDTGSDLSELVIPTISSTHCFPDFNLCTWRFLRPRPQNIDSHGETQHSLVLHIAGREKATAGVFLSVGLCFMSVFKIVNHAVQLPTVVCNWMAFRIIGASIARIYFRMFHWAPKITVFHPVVTSFSKSPSSLSLSSHPSTAGYFMWMCDTWSFDLLSLASCTQHSAVRIYSVVEADVRTSLQKWRQ